MNCEFCAETIPDDAEKCPSCGELLVDSDYDGGGSSTTKIIVIVIAVILVLFVCGIGLLATLMMPALMKAKEKANKTKCSNNLRQLGLAGLQYADDKRFFPHMVSLKDLDGDYTTNHTPKKVRALAYYGYHDNPEGFVCPSSFDMFIPSPNRGTRSWFWQGGTAADPSLSPYVDGEDDPVFEECDELSYGWSRKGMNTNARSTSKVAADRSVRTNANLNMAKPMEFGNHDDGHNVLSVDATVQWVPYPNDGTLGDTQGQKAGYLDVLDQ